MDESYRGGKPDRNAITGFCTVIQKKLALPVAFGQR
jgi:hypothetical protein